MDDLGEIPELVDADTTSAEDAPEGLSIPNLADANDSEHPPRTVPLTIISGFLGAGKSTLVRRILTERHGYRIAVIMNEFGDTADIEAKTINVSSPDDPSQQSEEFLELANGCLCCSIKDTGIAAIEKLMKRKGAFDHILLETTGLADPGPIASMFWQNEEFSQGLGRDIHLDGVVCVVDAVFGRQQMEEDHAADGIGESLRQIAAADVILLNKVDLVPPAEADATEAVIRGVNPAASIHRTVRGEIDLKHIMGIDAYASRQLLEVSGARVAKSHRGEHEHDHNHNNVHDHEHSTSPTHYEIRGISSLQIDCPKLSSQQLDVLDEWIRSVLWENKLPGSPSGDNSGLEVLRCKGLFVTTVGDLYVLQGVRNLYEIAKVEDEELGLPDAGKLVFIGKGLNEHVRRSLQEQLKII
ncbi:cobW-domain-containing protein [Dichomitus squalens]|uniref:CobW-domain-containing protein n=1 Tax=Dichomitus squalens TaxID=114155 RepID=A0A4Q9P0Q9_9APHY|nr:cobW-domain-containing protein [Dichomitus squalens LYAD-421 SS1]EJF63368.1 cobW-domain-containing protein [Dichomitus squalens LYAD-421 SS1]TBU47800.1 cobW-domain-containing protein [Dichomitus squalens]TBU62374.1 cobW-domain-containing protein [Dichomitus squalens]